MYFELYYAIKYLHVGHVELLTVYRSITCIKWSEHIGRILKNKTNLYKFRRNKIDKEHHHDEPSHYTIMGMVIYTHTTNISPTT